MIEWTEQQEQEMIAQAKAGDPEANYQLSLWALERGEEEPDEIRWNRLAAKCLVKAAQAGHGPAQERLQALLEQNAPPAAPEKKASPAEPVPISGARRARHTAAEEEAQKPARRSRRAAAGEEEKKPARRMPRIVPKEEVYDEDEEEPEDYEDEEEEDERPARRKKAKAGGRKSLPFSDWGEAQWRRMERICIGICALLIVAIAVMFFTGRRHGSGGNQSADPTVPQAGQVTEATPEPEMEPYPDDTVKAAIQASDIEVQPADLDYVKAATTATITVGTGNKTLRLRSGPNTNYRQLAEMPNGTAVDVFAKKDDWALVLYQADDGPLYGWCSSSYLITTSGSVG